eukprot:gene4215-3047_t
MTDKVGNDNELMEIEEIAVSDGGKALFAPVDVKNGEEKFEVIWEKEAKLLRFDEGENQWKERGQGVAKILQRKDNKGQYMFVFRREGIGKIAAQHYLVKGMKPKFHPQSDKAVLWTAFCDVTDDEEGFPENFILRCPSKELAVEALENLQHAIDSSTV